MKNKIWLILGLMPFIIVLVGGIYVSIFGFSPIWMSMIHYGWDAFRLHIEYWSYLYWPSYIVGIVLIIISIIRRGK